MADGTPPLPRTPPPPPSGTHREGLQCPSVTVRKDAANSQDQSAVLLAGCSCRSDISAPCSSMVIILGCIQRTGKSTVNKRLIASARPSGALRDVALPYLCGDIVIALKVRSSAGRRGRRVPSGCSVVSVDPVGLSAATSGYWVSAGGHS